MGFRTSAEGKTRNQVGELDDRVSNVKKSSKLLQLYTVIMLNQLSPEYSRSGDKLYHLLLFILIVSPSPSLFYL